LTGCLLSVLWEHGLVTWPDEVCAVVTDLDGTIVRADQTVSAAT
jgi:hypothetical protein